MMCEKPFIRRPVGLTSQAVVLSEEARLAGTPFPCGQCLPCRINRARVWQHRIMLEAMYHEKKCFVTLTYSDDFLPENCSLDKRDYQLFLKRIRSYFPRRRIRYFTVGEYGEFTGRPHFHLALFGVCFTERKFIEKAWRWEGVPMGWVDVGDITKDSARYMTGYVTKGWTKENDYTRDLLRGRAPEFMRCSTHNGGLGIDVVKDVAKRIEKFKEVVGVIGSLKHGKSERPLGRYLKKRLAEEMGKSVEYELEFDTYQRDLVARNMPFMEGGYYKDGIVSEKQRERKRQARVHKIFKQRRVI